MRPGNYAHEKWADLSMQIHGIKMHARNKYLRVHRPDDGSRLREIIITRAQARIYDYIIELRKENTDVYLKDLINIKFNVKSLEKLIYNKILKIKKENNNKIILI